MDNLLSIRGVQFIMGFTIPANVFCYMWDVHCMRIVKLRIHGNYIVLTETPFKRPILHYITTSLS